MHFTFSWLKEHLETEASAEDVSQALLQLGHENQVTTKFQYLSNFEVAKVLEVEPHPNADRLKLCKVQTQDSVLNIVCGAPNVRANIYVALAKLGQIIPSNGMEIKEAKIRGQMSQGMICSERELDVGNNADGIIELTQKAEIGKPCFHFLQNAEDEPLFSLTITPNRGDCFGVRGIARDLAAAQLGSLIPLDQVLKARSMHKQFEETIPLNFSVKVKDSFICPRFSYRIVKGIKNGESPHWLREKLRISKVRSINKVVDATNFLLYDLNRPFHGFNLNSLAGEGVEVVQSNKGDKFTGLDEVVYTLPKGVIVIRDSEKIVSLAGIMGSLASGTYNTTQDILLESAYFPPEKIAFAGQELAIDTHSRTRFERGIDTEFCGLDLVTQMILNLCGGNASPVKEYKVDRERKIINLPKDQVQKVTGLRVISKEILNRLGFQGDGDFLVPTWRHDCNHPNDLVEEVARVAGYENMPSVPMKMNSKFQSQPDPVRICRLACAQRGMWEAMTYCFVDEDVARSYGAENPILLSNPMQANALRPSVLPCLVESIKENISFGHTNLSLFEVGRVYASHGDKVQERICVAGVRFGKRSQDWRKLEEKFTPFHVKHDVLEITAGRGDYSLVSRVPSWYEIGQSLLVDGEVAAYFGQLDPSLTKGRYIMAFEVFLDKLHFSKECFQKYQPCRFQPVVRDFAFVVKNEITAGQILEAMGMEKEISRLVQKKEVFDIYKGQELGEGYKSVGVRIWILDRDKNFTREEINGIISRIEEKVCSGVGASMRA